MQIVSYYILLLELHPSGLCLIVLQSAIADCLSFAGVTYESSPGVLHAGTTNADSSTLL